MHSAIKTTLKITASAVILLVLVVGAGVGYIWYTGQHAAENSQAFAEPPEAINVGTLPERPKVNQTSVVGASVQSVTSPVTPGSNASIMVKTNRQATCTIAVVYDKTPAKDSGLAEKKSDDYGLVQWAWTVPANAPLGTWPITVTCANEKNSAVVENDLKIVRSVD